MSRRACATPSDIDLRVHQRRVRALSLAPDTAGVCVFHGTGTGKTVTASAVAACLLSQRSSRIRRVVVVTKSAVVPQFTGVIAAFLRTNKRYARAVTKREEEGIRLALAASPPPLLLPSCAKGGSGDRAPLFYGRSPDSNEHRRVVAEAPPVPPAYESIYYCHPNSRLAWAGRDAKGRLQSRYRLAHVVQQRSRRNLRVLQELTPALLRRYDRQLSKDIVAGNEMALVAMLVRDCALRLMHRGNDDGHDGHFGLTTLLVKHIFVSDENTVSLAFRGKSGKHNTCVLAKTSQGLRAAHEALAKRVRHMHADDRVFKISAGKINAYIAQAAEAAGYAGDTRLTAKDFRTYEANQEFVNVTSANSQGDGKRAAYAGFRAAAAKLNNTPAVAQRSYVSAALANFTVAMPHTYARTVGHLTEEGRLAAAIRALVSLFSADEMLVLDAMTLADAAAISSSAHDIGVPFVVGTHAEVVDLERSALTGALLVIDEAHDYVNDSTARKDMLRISGMASMTMCMSATPVVGGEEDMRAILRLAKGGRRGKVRVHVHDAKTSNSMARVRTKVTYITCPKGESAAFRRAPPGAFLISHRQMSAASPAKQQWIVQKVSELRRLGETPIVVYCEFLAPLNLLHKALRGAAVITGSMGSHRKEQVRRAVNDGAADVVVISAAGGTGVDFRGVRHIIFASLPWTSAAYQQVAGRGAREGSHQHLMPRARTVTLWPLILDAKHAPDQQLYRVITAKRELARRVIAEVATPKGVAHYLREL